MLDILEKIERDVLPRLLADEAAWKGVFVGCHAPFAERVWAGAELGGANYRIHLSRIPPCELSESLFHQRPWPSAMRILSGSCAMARGRGAGMPEPGVAATFALPAGARYEMVDRDAWRAVAPIGVAAYSLMVTGEPWVPESHKSSEELAPLDPGVREEILAFFKAAYPVEGGADSVKGALPSIEELAGRWGASLSSSGARNDAKSIAQTVSPVFEALARFGPGGVDLRGLDSARVHGIHLAAILRATARQKEAVPGWAEALGVAREALERKESTREKADVILAGLEGRR